jgi:thiamine biosynthesis protein ThiS
VEIILNGAPRTRPDDLTLAGLLELLDLGQRRIAVEINQTLVPRSRFPLHQLADQDRVEIIHAVGGG